MLAVLSDKTFCWGRGPVREGAQADHLQELLLEL